MDYSAYLSSGSYSLSKGPKSLYFGNDDQQLLGLVLPVPQTDVDDEWGGTLRIALERLDDYLSTLQLEVEDPKSANTGLVYKMGKLIGTSTAVPAAPALINLATPSLTLGDIVLNGSTNLITIGSNVTSLSKTNFTLGTDFKIDQITPNVTKIKYKDPEIGIQFYSDPLFPAATSLTIMFGATNALQLTSSNMVIGGGISVSLGALSVNGITDLQSITTNNQLSITSSGTAACVAQLDGVSGTPTFRVYFVTDPGVISLAAGTITLAGGSGGVAISSTGAGATALSSALAVTLTAGAQSINVAAGVGVYITSSPSTVELHATGFYLNCDQFMLDDKYINFGADCSIRYSTAGTKFSISALNSKNFEISVSGLINVLADGQILIRSTGGADVRVASAVASSTYINISSSTTKISLVSADVYIDLARSLWFGAVASISTSGTAVTMAGTADTTIAGPSNLYLTSGAVQILVSSATMQITLTSTMTITLTAPVTISLATAIINLNATTQIAWAGGSYITFTAGSFNIHAQGDLLLEDHVGDSIKIDAVGTGLVFNSSSGNYQFTNLSGAGTLTVDGSGYVSVV